MRIKLNDGRIVEIMVKQNESKGLYEYYTYDKYGHNQRIGVYDPNKMEENILMLNNTIENELSGEIKDKINQLDKSEIEIDAKENENIDKYAEELGIERDNIRDIRKIDLNEKLKGKTGKEKATKTYINKAGQDAKVATTKDVTVKQEIELDERANDMHSVRKWLGGKVPSEFGRIGIIESDQMDEMTNEKGEKYKNGSTRYSLIVIGKGGKIEPLQKYVPELQQRSASGNNPTAEKYQVRKDGSVDKDAVLSEYEIGNKIIQIDNKEMGRVELNIGQEENGGTETMGVQVRDSNSTYTTPTENRRVMGEYERNGQYTVDENLKEANRDKEYCEKMKTEDIDGDPQTKSHIDNIELNYIEYSNGERITFGELATRWGLMKDGRPDANHAKERVNELRQKNPTDEPEKIVEDLDEEYEDPRVNNDRNIG